MRRQIHGLGLGLVAALCAPVTFAHAEDVALDQVPAPVMETVKARFVDIKVVSAAKEKAEDGNLIYEITLDNDGMNIDVTLAPAGNMTLIEKQIDRKALPEPVAKTLEAKYPKARYRMVEEVINVKEKEEKLAYYEVLLVTPQKQIRAVEVDAEGKVLNVEKKTSEEED